jgi:hypothetical protein
MDEWETYFVYVFSTSVPQRVAQNMFPVRLAPRYVKRLLKNQLQAPATAWI